MMNVIKRDVKLFIFTAAMLVLDIAAFKPSSGNKDYTIMRGSFQSRIKRSSGLSLQGHLTLLLSSDDHPNTVLHLTQCGQTDNFVTVHYPTEAGTGQQKIKTKSVQHCYIDSRNDGIICIEAGEDKIHMYGTYRPVNGSSVMLASDLFDTNTVTNEDFIVKVWTPQSDVFEFDDLLYDERRSSSSTRARRVKRTTGEYTVELFIILDYSMYKLWYDISDGNTHLEKDQDAKVTASRYMTWIFHGMQYRYQNIQSSFSLNITLVGLYIVDNPSNSTWTESVVTSSGTVNVYSVINSFSEWVHNNKNNLPHHDHAMLFSRYDFENGGKTSNRGFASVGDICKRMSQSIIEFKLDFSTTISAAHELGHNLGAIHDDDTTGCPGNNGYVMAATMFPRSGQQARNPWIFSTCSVQAFSSLLQDLNNAGENCLSVSGANHDSAFLKKYGDLMPGQLYTANDQCKQYVGQGSYLCRSIHRNNYTSICSAIYCYNPKDDSCAANTPGDGTQCGDKMWCINGQCTCSPDAPAGDDACLYGDSPGTVLYYGQPIGTCTDVNNSPSYCYDSMVFNTCCNTCTKNKKAIPDCEYGNKNPSCKPDCRYVGDSAKICCESCYNPSNAVTTPPPPTPLSECRQTLSKLTTTTKMTVSSTQSLSPSTLKSTTMSTDKSGMVTTQSTTTSRTDGISTKGITTITTQTTLFETPKTTTSTPLHKDTTVNNPISVTPPQKSNFADELCRQLVGDGSYLCRSIHRNNYTSICSDMYCYKPDLDACVAKTPSDGTPCGDKMWCIKGTCTCSSDAPAGDDACLYGDSPGTVLHFGQPIGTCAVIPNSPIYCYDSMVFNTCCNTCTQNKKSIPDCEYGNKNQGCKPDCRYVGDSAKICCESCYNPSNAVTTPPPPTPLSECRQTLSKFTTEETTSSIHSLPPTSAQSSIISTDYSLNNTLSVSTQPSPQQTTMTEKSASSTQKAETATTTEKSTSVLTTHETTTTQKSTSVMSGEVTTIEKSTLVTSTTETTMPTHGTTTTDKSSAMPTQQTTTTDKSSVLPTQRTTTTDESSVMPTQRTTTTDKSSVMPTQETTTTNKSTVIPTKGTTATEKFSVIPTQVTSTTAVEKSSVMPTQGTTTTEKSSVMPTQGTTTTDKSSVMPTQGITTTGKSSVMPTQGNTTTEKSSVMPTQGITTTEKSSVIPTQGITTTDKSSVMPTQGNTTTDKSSVMPTQGNTTTEKSSVMPTQGITTTEKSSVIPTQGITTTEKSSVMPTQGNTTTEKSSVMPTQGITTTEKPSVIPTQGITTTEKSSVIPTQGITTTEKSSVMPTQGNTTTEKSSVIPTQGITTTGKSSVMPTQGITTTEKSSVMPTQGITTTEISSVMPTQGITTTEKSSVMPTQGITTTDKSSVMPRQETTAAEKSSVMPRQETTTAENSSVVLTQGTATTQDSSIKPTQGTTTIKSSSVMSTQGTITIEKSNSIVPTTKGTMTIEKSTSVVPTQKITFTQKSSAQSTETTIGVPTSEIHITSDTPETTDTDFLTSSSKTSDTSIITNTQTDRTTFSSQGSTTKAMASTTTTSKMMSTDMWTPNTTQTYNFTATALDAVSVSTQREYTSTTEISEITNPTTTLTNEFSSPEKITSMATELDRTKLPITTVVQGASTGEHVTSKQVNSRSSFSTTKSSTGQGSLSTIDVDTTTKVTPPETTTSSAATAFRFTIALDKKVEASDLNDTESPEYKSIHNKATETLTNHYQNTLGSSFVGIKINKLSVGSLVIDYDVIVKKDTQAATTLVKTAVDLVNNRTELMFDGQPVKTLSVKVSTKNGQNVTIDDTSNACDIYLKVTTCGDNEQCQNTANGPTCKKDIVQKETNDGSRELYRLIGLASGIVVLASVFCISVACVTTKRKRVKKHRLTEENYEKSPSEFRHHMPTKMTYTYGNDSLYYNGGHSSPTNDFNVSEWSYNDVYEMKSNGSFLHGYT